MSQNGSGAVGNVLETVTSVALNYCLSLKETLVCVYIIYIYIYIYVYIYTYTHAKYTSHGGQYTTLYLYIESAVFTDF